MITALNVGTVLGPHVMRDGERPARVGTLLRQKLPLDTADQRKRVTAISWGSSGRRFKSCQPDQGLRRSGLFRTSEVSPNPGR
jgi:hypothetical protein